MRTSALWKNYNDNHRAAALSALERIIDACRDGERGYAEAAEDIQEPGLKALFGLYAEQRRKFAEALEEHFEHLGGERSPHPRIAGRIHRRWLDLRSTIDHGSAVGMLAECERGEHAARARYEHALSIPMPPRVRDLLLEQLGEIQRAHDELDRMRGG
jgi:uncharacterized protein (TIGR02284 family)